MKPEFKKRKPYLLLDNHGAHKAIQSKQLLQRHFRILWQPSYTSQFNCIEVSATASLDLVIESLGNLEKESSEEMDRDLIHESRRRSSD